MGPLKIQPRASPDTFLLESVELLPGKARPRCCVLHPQRIAGFLQGTGESADAAFWFAIAAINEKEKVSRISIAKKLAPRSRNITLDVGRGVTDSIYLLLGMAAEKREEELDMNYQSLKERIADELSPVCDSLGLGPTVNLLTCRVTDEVIAATVNPGLQKSLRYWLTQGDLSVLQVGELQRQLEQDFPEEAAVVMAAVKATGSLGHLSAVSLDVQEEKIWVSLVNGDGDHLKLEAYKFLGMLEHPTDGRLFHRFESRKWQSTASHFVFKDYREGEVSGCFFPDQCRVDVAHVLEKGTRANDRCRFYLEREYLACLFIVLERLQKDREQITRLLENAEATQTFDPFEVIKGSHY